MYLDTHNNQIQYPLPPLDSNHLRATVSSHPRGNIPQVTIPSPPPITVQGTHDTKQDMRHEGIVFWREYDFEELHMLNKGHWNGLSSCRLGCHLGSRFGGLMHIEKSTWCNIEK